MECKRKIRVAVLFGGKSGEHEVSLVSAQSVMAAIDRTKCEVYPIGISKSGHWITAGDPMRVLVEGPGVPGGESAPGTSLALAGRRDLVPGMQQTRFPDVDVVFPVLHGTFGEDGTVQGLLEMADLAYVGAGVLGSALGLDKAAMKDIFRAHGLPIVDHLVVMRHTWRSSKIETIARIEGRFAYPVFVKPANLGSSVGISKAHDRAELDAALDEAARFDRKIVVEEAVNAREIECSVLGNDEPTASVIGEVVPCHEFYDYSAKYVDQGSELHIPADLPEATTRLVQELAIRAFLALDCAGMARADFFVSRDTGNVYINELNTIPGFTSISMYPKLWEASGLPYPKLLDRLIALAVERYQDKHDSVTYYSAGG
jgi:D-alanine-D-alanine ligase